MVQQLMDLYNELLEKGLFKKINPQTIENLENIIHRIKDGELVENNVITYVNTARSGGKTLVAKALAYDELQKKIEQGTLIELPCKVGTVLYEVIPKCTNGGLSCPYNGGYGTSRCKNGCGAYIAEEKFTFLSMREHFGKTLFLTREEAEKRLKELQNERD